MTVPFPFIVGSGRSGTTLLRAMLDAHPEMTIPGESYFVEQMARRRDGFADDAGRFDAERYLTELFADARFRTWQVDPAGVRRRITEERPVDLAAAVRATYVEMAAQRGATRFADKTPNYALCVDEIAALLPDAVFVHLIRDPRDVARSYLRVDWGPRTYTGAGLAWVDKAGAARASGERLGPDRYLEVRYDDLVADPAAELARICDFIGLDFRPSMLDDYRGGAVVRASLPQENGAHTAVAEAPTPGLRDWRTDLDPAEAARVGAVADELAVRLGFEPSPPLEGLNRLRSAVERAHAEYERMSLTFRRTRLANRLRGPWRRLRGRATSEQLGLPAYGAGD